MQRLIANHSSSRSEDDNYDSDQEGIKARDRFTTSKSFLTKNIPYKLVEIIKLLLLETKTRLDVLYQEILKISKQTLSTKVFTSEHLDNFFL